MESAVKRISRLGRQLTLGLKENGKQTATTRGFCKISTGKFAVKTSTGRKKINDLTSFFNVVFSPLFSALNKFLKIHYKTYNPQKKSRPQFDIIPSFLSRSTGFIPQYLRQVYSVIFLNLPCKLHFVKVTYKTVLNVVKNAIGA